MTAQSNSRKWPVFILVLFAILLLGFLVGVPLLEKRIAARFANDWATGPRTYQLEDAQASIFRRSVSTGKFSYQSAAGDILPAYTFSCARTAHTGLDWPTLLGFYPEVSHAASVKMEDCQVTMKGTPVADIKEISFADMRFRHKNAVDYHKNIAAAPTPKKLANADIAKMLSALEDCGIGNMTITGIDISGPAMSLTIPHAEVNNFNYLSGCGKGLVKDIKLMALGQKLFGLEEISVDRMEWLLIQGYIKALEENRDLKNLSTPELFALYAYYPFVVQNFKLGGLEVNGSQMLTGSNDNIASIKEIVMNTHIDKNIQHSSEVNGLVLNLAALKKLPPAQKFADMYAKPLRLNSSWDMTIEDPAGQGNMRLAVNLHEEALGGAKFYANTGKLYPLFPHDKNNFGIQDIEATLTDTGVMNLVWRLLAGSGGTPEAIKAEAMKDLDEEMGKSASPVSVKAHQAMRDFLEHGGQLSIKVKLPEPMPPKKISAMLNSETAQSVEVNWVPPKQ